MIVSKQGFKRNYAFGGSGILDSMGSMLRGFVTSNAAKQLASSLLDAGKNVVKNVVTDVGTRLVKKILTPKSKKNMQKYTASPNKLNANDAVKLNELVSKLNKGMGIKKI